LLSKYPDFALKDVPFLKAYLGVTNLPDLRPMLYTGTRAAEEPANHDKPAMPQPRVGFFQMEGGLYFSRPGSP
jgi:hypothetical protein